MYKLLCSNLTKSHRSLTNFTGYYRKVAQKYNKCTSSDKKYVSETDLETKEPIDESSELVECSEETLESETPSDSKTKSYCSFFTQGIKRAPLAHTDINMEPQITAATAIPSRLFHSTDVNNKRINPPKKKPFRNKDAEKYYQSAVEQCMEIKEKLNKFCQEASWEARPPKLIFDLKKETENPKLKKKVEKPNFRTLKQQQQERQFKIPELDKIAQMKTVKPNDQFKQGRIHIKYPISTVRYKMGAHGYKLQHKVKQQVMTNNKLKTVYKDTVPEPLQPKKPKRETITGKQKVVAQHIKNKAQQKRSPFMVTLFQQKNYDENSEEAKQQKKLNQATIIQHPTVRQANVSVKMAFKNRYNKLLQKSGLLYRQPTKKEQKIKAEDETVAKGTDAVKEEKQTVEQPSTSKPASISDKKEKLSPKYSDTEETVSEPQVKEHPIASSKQVKIESPLTYPKRILSEKWESFDIDAMCIKNNSNTNTTTTYGDYVAESEEKVKTFVEVHKQEAKDQQNKPKPKVEPVQEDVQRKDATSDESKNNIEKEKSASDGLSEYLKKLKELRDQTAIDGLKVRKVAQNFENKTSPKKKSEDHFDKSPKRNDYQKVPDETLQTKHDIDKHNTSLKQYPISDKFIAKRNDNVTYKPETVVKDKVVRRSQSKEDKTRTASGVNLRQEKTSPIRPVSLKTIRSENFPKKVKLRSSTPNMKPQEKSKPVRSKASEETVEIEKTKTSNPLTKIMEQYKVSSSPDFKISMAEIKRINRRKRREREKRLKEEVKMQQRKLEEAERTVMVKEKEAVEKEQAKKHKYRLDSSPIANTEIAEEKSKGSVDSEVVQTKEVNYEDLQTGSNETEAKEMHVSEVTEISQEENKRQEAEEASTVAEEEIQLANENDVACALPKKSEVQETNENPAKFVNTTPEKKVEDISKTNLKQLVDAFKRVADARRLSNKNRLCKSEEKSENTDTITPEDKKFPGENESQNTMAGLEKHASSILDEKDSNNSKYALAKSSDKAIEQIPQGKLEKALEKIWDKQKNSLVKLESKELPAKSVGKVLEVQEKAILKVNTKSEEKEVLKLEPNLVKNESNLLEVRDKHYPDSKLETEKVDSKEISKKNSNALAEKQNKILKKDDKKVGSNVSEEKEIQNVLELSDKHSSNLQEEIVKHVPDTGLKIPADTVVEQPHKKTIAEDVDLSKKNPEIDEKDTKEVSEKNSTVVLEEKHKMASQELTETVGETVNKVSEEKNWQNVKASLEKQATNALDVKEKHASENKGKILEEQTPTKAIEKTTRVAGLQTDNLKDTSKKVVSEEKETWIPNMNVDKIKNDASEVNEKLKSKTDSHKQVMQRETIENAKSVTEKMKKSSGGSYLRSSTEISKKIASTALQPAKRKVPVDNIEKTSIISKEHESRRVKDNFEKPRNNFQTKETYLWKNNPKKQPNYIREGQAPKEILYNKPEQKKLVRQNSIRDLKKKFEDIASNAQNEKGKEVFKRSVEKYSFKLHDRKEEPALKQRNSVSSFKEMASKPKQIEQTTKENIQPEEVSNLAKTESRNVKKRKKFAGKKIAFKIAKFSKEKSRTEMKLPRKELKVQRFKKGSESERNTVEKMLPRKEVKMQHFKTRLDDKFLKKEDHLTSLSKTQQENLIKLKEASTKIVKLVKKIDFTNITQQNVARNSEKSALPENRPTIRREKPPDPKDKSKKEKRKPKPGIVLPPKNRNDPKIQHTSSENTSMQTPRIDVQQDLNRVTSHKYKLESNVQAKKSKSLTDLERERYKTHNELAATWIEEKNKIQPKTEVLKNETKLGSSEEKHEIEKEGLENIYKENNDKESQHVTEYKKQTPVVNDARLYSEEKENTELKKEGPKLVIKLRYMGPSVQVKSKDKMKILRSRSLQTSEETKKQVKLVRSDQAIGKSTNSDTVQHLEVNTDKIDVRKRGYKIPNIIIYKETSDKQQAYKFDKSATDLYFTNMRKARIEDNVKTARFTPRDVIFDTQKDMDLFFTKLKKVRIEDDQIKTLEQSPNEAKGDNNHDTALFFGKVRRRKIEDDARTLNVRTSEQSSGTVENSASVSKIASQSSKIKQDVSQQLDSKTEIRSHGKQDEVIAEQKPLTKKKRVKSVTKLKQGPNASRRLKTATGLTTRRQSKKNMLDKSTTSIKKFVRRSVKIKRVDNPKTPVNKEDKGKNNIKKLIKVMKTADKELEEVLKAYEVFETPHEKNSLKPDKDSTIKKGNKLKGKDVKKRESKYSDLNKTKVDEKIYKNTIDSKTFIVTKDKDKATRRSDSKSTGVINKTYGLKQPTKTIEKTPKNLLCDATPKKQSKGKVEDTKGKIKSINSSIMKYLLTSGGGKSLLKETKGKKKKEEKKSTNTVNTSKTFVKTECKVKEVKSTPKGCKMKNKKSITSNKTLKANSKSTNEVCSKLTSSDSKGQHVEQHETPQNNSGQISKRNSDGKLLLQLLTKDGKEALGNKIVVTCGNCILEDSATGTGEVNGNEEMAIMIPGKKKNNVSVATSQEMHVSMSSDTPHDTSTPQITKKLRFSDPELQKYEPTPSKLSSKIKKEHSEVGSTKKVQLGEIQDKKNNNGDKNLTVQKTKHWNTKKPDCKLERSKSKAHFPIYRSSLIDMFIKPRKRYLEEKHKRLNTIFVNAQVVKTENETKFVPRKKYILESRTSDKDEHTKQKKASPTCLNNLTRTDCKNKLGDSKNKAEQKKFDKAQGCADSKVSVKETAATLNESKHLQGSVNSVNGSQTELELIKVAQNTRKNIARTKYLLEKQLEAIKQGNFLQLGNSSSIQINKNKEKSVDTINMDDLKQIHCSGTRILNKGQKILTLLELKLMKDAGKILAQEKSVRDLGKDQKLKPSCQHIFEENRSNKKVQLDQNTIGDMKSKPEQKLVVKEVKETSLENMERKMYKVDNLYLGNAGKNVEKMSLIPKNEDVSSKEKTVKDHKGYERIKMDNNLKSVDTALKNETSNNQKLVEHKVNNVCCNKTANEVKQEIVTEKKKKDQMVAPEPFEDTSKYKNELKILMMHKSVVTNEADEKLGETQTLTDNLNGKKLENLINKEKKECNKLQKNDTNNTEGQVPQKLNENSTSRNISNKHINELNKDSNASTIPKLSLKINKKESATSTEDFQNHSLWKNSSKQIRSQVELSLLSVTNVKENLIKNNFLSATEPYLKNWDTNLSNKPTEEKNNYKYTSQKVRQSLMRKNSNAKVEIIKEERKKLQVNQEECDMYESKKTLHLNEKEKTENKYIQNKINSELQAKNLLIHSNNSSTSCNEKEEKIIEIPNEEHEYSLPIKGVKSGYVAPKNSHEEIHKSFQKLMAADKLRKVFAYYLSNKDYFKKKYSKNKNDGCELLFSKSKQMLQPSQSQERLPKLAEESKKELLPGNQIKDVKNFTENLTPEILPQQSASKANMNCQNVIHKMTDISDNKISDRKQLSHFVNEKMNDDLEVLVQKDKKGTDEISNKLIRSASFSKFTFDDVSYNQFDTTKKLPIKARIEEVFKKHYKEDEKIYKFNKHLVRHFQQRQEKISQTVQPQITVSNKALLDPRTSEVNEMQKMLYNFLSNELKKPYHERTSGFSLLKKYNKFEGVVHYSKDKEQIMQSGQSENENKEASRRNGSEKKSLPFYIEKKPTNRYQKEKVEASPKPVARSCERLCLPLKNISQVALKPSVEEMTTLNQPRTEKIQVVPKSSSIISDKYKGFKITHFHIKRPSRKSDENFLPTVLDMKSKSESSALDKMNDPEATKRQILEFRYELLRKLHKEFTALYEKDLNKNVGRFEKVSQYYKSVTENLKDEDRSETVTESKSMEELLGPSSKPSFERVSRYYTMIIEQIKKEKEKKNGAEILVQKLSEQMNEVDKSRNDCKGSEQILAKGMKKDNSDKKDPKDSGKTD